MKLRKLEDRDAPLMLSWMHDVDVVIGLGKDFQHMTLEDCRYFIDAAQDIAHDLHLAIADDQNEYQGTVSLKHIAGGRAEFAIVVRREAMGQGFSSFAMTEIIRVGLEKIGLKEIYWNVLPTNLRARKFYDKHGYERIESENLHLNGEYYTYSQIHTFLWYHVCRS